MFTEPVTTTESVPAQESDAVAPASEYKPPHWTLTEGEPFSVITGMVVSTTVTVRVRSTAALPDGSETL